MTDFIMIGGATRPFRFAWKALKELRAMSKQNAEQAKNPVAVDDLKVFLLGFKYGAIHEKQESLITEEMLEDWFEEEPEKFAEITALYLQQLGKMMGGIEAETKLPKPELLMLLKALGSNPKS